MYAFVEHYCAKRWPRNKFLNKEYTVRLPGLGSFKLNAFRLVWRTVYVIITTIVSMLIPFFNSVLGILGAVGFWPLTVYYPIEMYIRQVKVSRRKYWLLQALSLFTLVISLAGLIGGVAGIIQALKDVKLFAATKS